MLSDRAKEMLSYLPRYYDASRVKNAILDTSGLELDDFRLAFKEILLQSYVDTLTEWGVSLWEQELALTPPPAADLDLRKAIIRAKLLRPPTMTPPQIERIVNCFVPNQDAKVIHITKSYNVHIKCPSFIPWQSQQEMLKTVEEAKPAHLAFTYIFERETNSTLYFGGSAAIGTKLKIKPLLKYQERIDTGLRIGNVLHQATKLIIGPNRFTLQVAPTALHCGALAAVGTKTTVLPRPPSIQVASSDLTAGFAMLIGQKIIIKPQGGI